MAVFESFCNESGDSFVVEESETADDLLLFDFGGDAILSKENALKLADAIQKHYGVK